LQYDVNSVGRVRVRVPRYGQYSAHRLAFMFMEGKWPNDEIDHVDGNPSNNAWSNLRHATRSQNAQNQRRAQSTSSTGLLGVGKNGDKFYARIYYQGVITYLGTFDTAKEAHEVYVKVKRELHPFGEL
jgi:HNH endonuclease